MPTIALVSLGSLGLPLDLLVESTAASVEGLVEGAELVSYEMIQDLNRVPAGRIDVRLPLTTMLSTQVTVRSTWILIASGDQILELTLQSEQSFYPDYQADFKQVIQSFSLTAP